MSKEKEIQKFKLENLLNQTMVQDADFVAIHIYPHGLYLILKCNFVVENDSEDSNVLKSVTHFKKYEVITRETYKKIIKKADSPLVFNSGYLEMEPFRQFIEDYRANKI